MSSDVAYSSGRDPKRKIGLGDVGNIYLFVAEIEGAKSGKVADIHIPPTSRDVTDL